MNKLMQLGITMLSFSAAVFVAGLFTWILITFDPIDIISYFISGLIIFGISFILLGYVIEKLKDTKGGK